MCCHNEENAQVQVRDGVGTVNPIFNHLTRIVGGKEASPGEFPYMVFLKRNIIITSYIVHITLIFYLFN